MSDEFAVALRMWEDATHQYDEADPSDPFAIDEAALRLSAAELHVRAVLERERRRMGKAGAGSPAEARGA